MDDIAVDSGFRGQGVGSLLLDHIVNYAKSNGFSSVRLDVIDRNPRARKLCESKGFVAVKVARFLYLKWLVGFSGVTTRLKQRGNMDISLLADHPNYAPQIAKWYFDEWDPTAPNITEDMVL